MSGLLFSCWGLRELCGRACAQSRQRRLGFASNCLRVHCARHRTRFACVYLSLSRAFPCCRGRGGVARRLPNVLARAGKLAGSGLPLRPRLPLRQTPTRRLLPRRVACSNVGRSRSRCRIILAFDNVAAVCGFSYALMPRGAGFARMVDSMKTNDFDYRTAQWAVRTRAARSAAQGLRGRLVAR